MKLTKSLTVFACCTMALIRTPNAAAQSATPAPATASPTPAGPSASDRPWLDLGTFPPDFSPAPKSTPLGQDVLSLIAPAPLDQGRIIFNMRARFEDVSQTALNSSKALTLRTRVGYETPKWNGFYGQFVLENTWAEDYSSYSPVPAPLNNGKAVIADTRNNQINNLFIGYAGFNSDLKAGRQDINLDNQRFVGTSDWRQNDETYDAVRLTNQALKDIWLSYTWNWQVNRIYGDYAPTPTLRRFDSNNHFLNIHYTGLPQFGTLGAYVYYLDLSGATAPRVSSAGTQPLSSTTAGVFFDGRYKFDADWALIYRAEYADQTSNHYSGPGPSYSESYNNFILGGAYQKFEAGAAYEKLGGDGTRAFQTPLATLHPFNGWANQFLTTPAIGLRDYYLWARSPLPFEMNLSAQAHYFTATTTASTYGHELDAAVSRKFGDNTTAMLKLARYWGNGAPHTGVRADVTKIWLQVEFSL